MYVLIHLKINVGQPNNDIFFTTFFIKQLFIVFQVGKVLL